VTVVTLSKSSLPTNGSVGHKVRIGLALSSGAVVGGLAQARAEEEPGGLWGDWQQGGTVRLVELEIARHDWSREQCAYGWPAAHVADDLRRLAGVDESSGADLEIFEGHVLVSSFVHGPAVRAVSVVLAALAAEASDYARAQFAQLLLFSVGDDGQSLEAERDGRDLVAECAAAAKPGKWLLYAEIFSGRRVDAAGCAYETLSLIEEDAEWLDRVRVAAGELLPWALR